MSAVARSPLLVLLTLLVPLLAPAAPARKAPRFPERQADAARVERVLQALSVREKVGQLLLAYPQVGKETPVEVGGVLFVGTTLRKLDAARERIRSARERARVPPFFAVDIEGGNFNRLQRHPALQKLPGAQELAALEDGEVEAWGARVGAAMRDVGLNMNLAPVFDVAARGHMFRNGRAFSGDAARVRQKATAFARGLARAGVAPIGKHFPGYGDLDADSDHVRALADWTQERVRQEAAVFRAADTVLGGVMMSNIVYTAYGPAPAILEPSLVALAHEGGGLAVTDDVAIAALAEHLGSTREEVVRRAFLAGNDLILTTEPPDWSGGLDYFGILVPLVQSNPKYLEQLDAAVRRVLRLKDRLGLLEGWTG
ncbi:glycoside hydrolase family 3 N-terminal domain-containing protein [Melittangium boletus]|uniref:glycoside hydrolase family 3 N-terminal domain-containing protein n=1 Tax=Melittangium boletus TaxID=83453 RepID=UPI003DA44B78